MQKQSTRAGHVLSAHAHGLGTGQIPVSRSAPPCILETPRESHIPLNFRIPGGEEMDSTSLLSAWQTAVLLSCAGDTEGKKKERALMKLRFFYSSRLARGQTG